MASTFARCRGVCLYMEKPIIASVIIELFGINEEWHQCAKFNFHMLLKWIVRSRMQGVDKNSDDNQTNSTQIQDNLTCHHQSNKSAVSLLFNCLLVLVIVRFSFVLKLLKEFISEKEKRHEYCKWATQ